MMNKPSKAKAENAILRRKVAELEAQLASSYHFASATLDSAGDRNQGGAVIVRLTALGGKELIVPVAIKNGLSQATLAALRADIARSWDNAIELAPKR